MPVVWTALLLVLPTGAAAENGGPFGLALAGGWIALLSFLTFALYAFDKRRARHGAVRDPERHLHFLEFLGGWPGALLAQRWLRHKSAKASYQRTFWTIVILHQLVAADGVCHWPLTQAAFAALRRWWSS